MDWILLVTILLSVLLLFLIIGIVKKLLKIVIVLGIIFLVLLFITNGAIINDFNNLKDKLPTSSTIVLLEKDGSIITGFLEKEGIHYPMDNAQIALNNGLYKEGKLDDIKGDNYKLYIIKSQVLDGLSDIEINNKLVLLGDLKEFLLLDKSLNSITFEDLLLDVDIERGDMGAAVFAYLYETELKISKSPIYFFKNYKADNIEVYPETAFFKFAKMVPLQWMDEKLNKLKDTISDKTKETVTGAVVAVKEKIKEAVD